MNNIKKFFLLNALILASIGAIAQKIIIFNPSPDFYILQPGIQNTAAYDNEKLFSSLNYKNRLGVISEIRDLYFDICLPINLNQRTGIKLYSEQETSLFTKNKY